MLNIPLLRYMFADRCRRSLAEVNLERHADLAPAFARNDPAYLLNVLEALPEVGPIGPGGLLFLDEIQAVPDAISALRYFREDMPNLPVLVAGSLLDFALADHRASMPVGRIAYLHMGPMSFTEFLNAVGAEGLARIVDAFEIERGLDVAIHKRLLELLRMYFFTGGMPEAVQAYARTRRFRDVVEVHTSIIDTYREDFSKYIGSRSLGRIVNVFNFAARNVGRKASTSTSPGKTRRPPPGLTSNCCAWRGSCRRWCTATATAYPCRRMPMLGQPSSCSWMLA